MKCGVEKCQEYLLCIMERTSDSVNGARGSGSTRCNTHTHTHTLITADTPLAPPQGMDYFAKGQARLERMMASGGVAAAKVTEMARKASVLSAFSPDAGDKEDEGA